MKLDCAHLVLPMALEKLNTAEIFTQDFLGKYQSLSLALLWNTVAEVRSFPSIVFQFCSTLS